MQTNTESRSAPNQSTVEDNKRALRRLIEEVLGKGDFALLDELMSETIKEHQRGNGEGKEGAREVFAGLRRAFPDFTATIQHIDAVDDRAWVLFRASGTHTGPFFGMPPTGKPISIDVMDLVRFEDGKIVEHWGVPDQLGMLIQIGKGPTRE